MCLSILRAAQFPVPVLPAALWSGQPLPLPLPPGPRLHYTRSVLHGCLSKHKQFCNTLAYICTYIYFELILQTRVCLTLFILYNQATVKMKALKCKTLGGIHIHHALSHIEQQVPRTFHTDRLCIYCACAYECLAAPCRPSPVSRLFHAGCTSS